MHAAPEQFHCDSRQVPLRKKSEDPPHLQRVKFGFPTHGFGNLKSVAGSSQVAVSLKASESDKRDTL
jgi:hypothetical protein